MQNVTPLDPKIAASRKATALRQLHEVNARVNHGAEHLAVVSTKTLHRGVDLRKAIAKVNALQMQHLWKKGDFEFGLDEEGEALVLARIGKRVYVLRTSDDFCHRLDQYPVVVTEVTVEGALGRWQVVSPLNDN